MPKGVRVSRKGKMTQVKLQRERALADRRREKQARRTAPKEQTGGGVQDGAEDPDLAGIRLGPQPPQEWQIEE